MSERAHRIEATWINDQLGGPHWRHLCLDCGECSRGAALPLPCAGPDEKDDAEANAYGATGDYRQEWKP